jgi:carbonic anhydrase
MVQQLIDGFKAFVEEEYTSHIGTMNALVEDGQDPDYFIISCIDSRSNPGTIFQPKPGTFFAHKAMGAIVRPYKKGTALSAALQFALDYNKVREIIILGHTGCGAIQSLISGIEDEEISSFLGVAQSGLETAKHKCGPSCSSDQHHRHTEEEIVLQSAQNLKGYPSVKRALEAGRVTIRPWLFDMENGLLLEYNKEKNEFLPITDD